MKNEFFDIYRERVREYDGSRLFDLDKAYFDDLFSLLGTILSEKEKRTYEPDVNAELYKAVENYSENFLNPDRAGALLSMWFNEVQGLAQYVYFDDRDELFCAVLETSIRLLCAFEAGFEEGIRPTEDELKDIIYSYLNDYAELFMTLCMHDQYAATDNFIKKIVTDADLCDTSYLYRYGLFVGEEELETASAFNKLTDEEADRMAATYVNGYIEGFRMTGKDITRKSTVVCYMPLGMEKFMRRAVEMFEEKGLKCILSFYPSLLFTKRTEFNVRPGVFGKVSLQCELDHREDMALFFGNRLRSRKLQVLERAYEQFGVECNAFSGHACVERFGSAGSDVKRSKNAPAYTQRQLKLKSEYQQRARIIANDYIPDEETSFTIISWPVPAVSEGTGASYSEILSEIIRVNTLDSTLWRSIQESLINVLDRAKYVEVKGTNGNETDLRIMLRPLNEGETNFENCLADVNIPVGEVFTSPVLKGTTGLLNVKSVYINGFLYHDLRIRFEDGIVTECDSLEGSDAVKRMIFDNKEKLPMGEFAIGTNTVAYAVSKRYGIESKMPVLIAEKTGPHFAVGDTCYSYEEELVTFNPDGKKIVAKDNELSRDKKYFHVHRDITIPYEEIGSLTAIGKDREDIIVNGRFVTKGTEKLNEALD